MSARIVTVMLSLALCVIPAPAEEPDAQPPAETPREIDVPAVVAGANAFACEVYGHLASQDDSNLFLSPASIHTALAMTYAGAAGRTAEQMAKVLHLPGDGPELHAAFAELIAKLNSPRKDREGNAAYDLALVNALWGQKGYAFQPVFLELLKASYGAGLEAVDFAQTEQARQAINEWVAKQTKDKIEELVPPGVLSDATRLVLTNAVYFKSRWADEFSKSATKKAPFRRPGKKDVEAPMMHQEEDFVYMETEMLQALSLPYLRHELSMIVLLPKAVDGLEELEKALTGERLEAWIKQMRTEKVQVTLPKFKFTCELAPADVLKRLGMADAFSREKADFSGITAAEELFVSAVLHKAFVAVDEEGTEAAAATAIGFAATAMPVPREPKVFTADHPFVFLIRHRATGAILFMGRVTNPMAQ